MTKSNYEIAHEYHDFVASDLTEADIRKIKEASIKDYVDSASMPLIVLFCRAFLGFLTSKGYRIVKIEKEDQYEIVKTYEMRDEGECIAHIEKIKKED